MRVLVIGYGSIGRRHAEILRLLGNHQVDIVSKQEIKNSIVYRSLEDIRNLEQFDYFVITSETAKHFEQLDYICSRVSNKKILIEKPLFEKSYSFKSENNIIFVAYNLRFHPVMKQVKALISEEQVYYANIMCGQYLPSWRPERDYRECYSAKLSQGGGVLRDLSHELDYAAWLFGDITQIKAVNAKVSDLEIDSDDIFAATAISEHNVIMNISMDYISKVPIRRMVIHTRQKTIEADLIKNIVRSVSKSGEEKITNYGTVGRNLSYECMHQALINGELSELCSYDAASKTMRLIDQVSASNL